MIGRRYAAIRWARRKIVLPGVAFSPFLLDILTTGVTSAATVVCMILVIRILATELGPQEFGAYMLSRRVLTVLFPILTLFLGTALPRYLGLHLGDVHRRNQYVVGASILVGAITLAAAIVLWGFAASFARLLFGDPAYETLVRAIGFLLVGTAAYSMLYAIHRGLLQMRTANLWELGVIAVGPLLLAFFFARGGDASRIVFLFGGLAFLALPFLAWKWAGSLREGGTRILGATRELVVFGAPRVPAGFAVGALLALGPLLAPHLGRLADAGLLAVGIAVFRVVEAPFTVFGLVALPRLAHHLGAGNQDLIRDRVGDLTAFLFHAGLFATLHLWLWSDIIIRIWLGEAYDGAVAPTRIYMLALVPYLSYVLLRSVIDAITVKAVITFAALSALVVGVSVAVVLSLMTVGVAGLAIATLAGLATLGSLIMIYAWDVLRFDLGLLLVKRIILVNLGLFLLAWVLKEAWATTDAMALVKLVVLECAAGAAYLALLWWWRVGWMEQIRLRIKASEG